MFIYTNIYVYTIEFSFIYTNLTQIVNIFKKVLLAINQVNKVGAESRAEFNFKLFARRKERKKCVNNLFWYIINIKQ